jgi:hypothetical protein
MRRIVDLPAHGTLLAATDFQGNLRDFKRIQTLFEIRRKKDPDTFLVITGDLVHGPEFGLEEWPEHLGSYYMGESKEVLLAAYQLQQKYPERVFYLLGNHEHAHVGGPVVGKFFMDEAARLEEILGPDQSNWFREWLLSWPLVAVAEQAQICLLHGAPFAAIQSRQDIERIVFDDYEHVMPYELPSRTVLGAILWARGAKPERARQFLRALHPKLATAIHGHDVAREGFYVEGETHICVSTSFGCFDGDKVYVEWDLSEPCQSAFDVIQRGIRRLWPQEPTIYLDSRAL